MKGEKVSVFWYRRDLRIEDNAGLYYALKEQENVLPLFIFDTLILDKLNDRSDARVTFIHDTITALKKQFNQIGSDLIVKHGDPLEVLKTLTYEYDIVSVYTNHDYEPYAIKRDKAVMEILAKKEIPFKTFKDHCIFEFTEILKPDGTPYTVFTPYSKKWMEKLNPFYLRSYPSGVYTDKLFKTITSETPTLVEMGFTRSTLRFPPITISSELIKSYEKTRNFPSVPGTSQLGIHFRFGTISIREKARKSLQLSQTWLNELIWRDFYIQILANFPHVTEGSFKPAYDRIEWNNNTQDFKAWCEGKTGYPLVDAGMRELNATGYMHNRVRMVTASFLCKHLLIDWRWGEAYFASKLLDFDLASNNGGWQWASGSGTDSAPYFRIFNPALQMEKFDKQLKYIKKWVPEYGTASYARPVVEHTYARERCLTAYKKALNS